MSGKTRLIGLASVSGIAILATMLWPADEASACTFDPVPGPGIAVSCDPFNVNQNAPFSTSYTDANGTVVYDGNEADTVTIVSDEILVGNYPVPLREYGSVYGIFPLVGSPGVIKTLGGNDTFEISGGQVGDNGGAVDVDLGDGADQFGMSGGSIFGTVYLGEGGDTFTMSDGTISQDVDGGAGNDTLTFEDGTILGSLIGGAGADNLTVSGGTISQDVDGGAGDDTLTFNGGTILGNVIGGYGVDIVEFKSGALIGDIKAETVNVYGGSILGNVIGGDGDDYVQFNAGELTGGVDLGEGENLFIMWNGTIGQNIYGGSDRDHIEMLGGQVGSVYLYDGEDHFVMTGGTVNGSVYLGEGANTFIMNRDLLNTTGGVINGGIYGGSDSDRIEINFGQVGSAYLLDGNDNFVMTGGTVNGSVYLGEGANTFTMDRDLLTMTGGTIDGSVIGGGDGDHIEINYGQVGAVNLRDGADDFVMTDGLVSGNVGLGKGDDTFIMNGGTIGGDVDGGGGEDGMIFNGGTVMGNVIGSRVLFNYGDVIGSIDTSIAAVHSGSIGGSIHAETVALYGGSIGGDITRLSISPSTPGRLLIDDSVNADALQLRDGVVFSGDRVIGTIANTDLAAMGSQNFEGFTDVSVTASTLRFNGSEQGIGSLRLSDGSTLYSNGATTLTGSLSLSDSTLDMIDGATGDTFTLGAFAYTSSEVLTLGGLALNNATIAIDFDQQAGLTDTLAVNGSIVATGNNVIFVNVLGTPDPSAITEATLISLGAPVDGTFTVAGISDEASQLFDYRVLSSADGLILRATPYGTIAAMDAVAIDQSAETMTGLLYSVNEDAIKHGLGLSPGAPVGGSPNFAVFASGQLAKVDHDGFSISNGLVGFQGASFSADEFSAAISLDFDAARHFGFDQEYGLNLGIFGGYASTELVLDGFGGLDTSGWARNEAGLGGGYALLRKQTNYLLVSAMGLFGNTHVNNQVIGGTGNYDTTGYALNASAGRIFALSDTIRFDLRGGILGAWFTGDSYTDSAGLTYGKSRLSFGAVRFEPGIYADRQLENGMVLSPYLRGELAQRFGYSNTSSVAGQEFEFDDADFSAALSAGFNLKVSKTATISLEGRARASSDSRTGGGKLGLKVAF